MEIVGKTSGVSVQQLATDWFRLRDDKTNPIFDYILYRSNDLNSQYNDNVPLDDGYDPQKEEKVVYDKLKNWEKTVVARVKAFKPDEKLIDGQLALFLSEEKK